MVTVLFELTDLTQATWFDVHQATDPTRGVILTA